MLLFTLALAPIFLIIWYIYHMDKYEKEPKHLLFFSFLLGAIVSIIIATLFYVVFDIFLPLNNESSIIQMFIKAFFVVGVSEEFSKYIVTRYYAQPKDDYNEPFDGIVYAVMVSMGFASTENIFYIIDGGVETAIIRIFTAVPAHATFGIIMGYYMGKAKFSKNKTQLNLKGLLLAVLFHGTYDFFLFIDSVPGIYLGSVISLITALVLSRRALKSHQKNSFFKP